jgi:amino acid transporter
MQFLSYIFWPRPPATGYDNPKIQAILVVCFALIVASFVLKRWRRKISNPVTKKLSRSWPTACIWFGIIGLVLAISRADDISYMSMRFWWVVWIVCLALYLYIQVRVFKAKHYEKIPTENTEDPRKKYLPKKKRR